MVRWQDSLRSTPTQAAISRRTFTKLALAAGFSATATRALGQTQPKRGGSARISCSGTTNDTLDPRLNTTEFVQVVFFGAVSNALCETDVDGKLVGDLAETFETEAGATKWVFKLKKGLEFHNGKSVTPDDVIATFRHHMGDDSISGAKNLVASITDIRADGPQNVIFTLDAGNVDFPDRLAGPFFSIMPAVDGKVDWQSGVRTGPYILESWQAGVFAKVKRNPNYHKEGKPYFDNVDFTVINDTGARMNALVAGDVDVIASRPDLAVIDLILQQNPDLRVTSVPGTFCVSMPMNITVPPFDNRDVRHAIKWALHREQVAKVIFRGYAKPGNDNLIHSGMRYAINPEPVFHYDPERVKFHLGKAGLQSLNVDLSMSDTVVNGAVDAALLLSQHAAKCNVNINVIREPIDGYWDNVWLKKPWCGSNQFGSGTIDQEFSTHSAADAPWNATGWKDPRFNELLVKARAEIDPDKRAAMYAEMQQLHHDEDGNIVLVFTDFVYAHSSKLSHGKISSNGPSDDLKIAERWWAA
jgi:peptide/nickel transport system substrate-binding protein